MISSSLPRRGDGLIVEWWNDVLGVTQSSIVPIFHHSGPLLADVVIVFHFLWILFLVFGFWFVLKRSRIAYLHAAGLLFSLILNLMGWYCPLTHLEYFLRSLHDPGTTHVLSFTERLLESVVYPDLEESVIRFGEVIFVVLNAVAYGWALKRGRSKQKAVPRNGTRDFRSAPISRKTNL